MDKMKDLEQQYDKIYRYCYFKTGHRETAEDITQETFLRFFESTGYQNIGKQLQYLYTIARNLCMDEFRRQKTKVLHETGTDISEEKDPAAFFNKNSFSSKDSLEDNILSRLAVKNALSQMEEEQQELLLLRYASEVPVSVLCSFYGISRFALYRRLRKASEQLKENLGKENTEYE